MIEGREALRRLVDEVLPFWIDHGIDPEHGGLRTCLDRRGDVLDQDKWVWQQFRFAWLLARCCRVLGPDPAWTAALDATLDFGLAHGFDEDGLPFFQLDRTGRPIRKRRYVYGACFASMALAETAALRRDPRLASQAVELLERFRRAMTTPGGMAPKTTEHRRGRPLGHPVISLGVAQVLRDAIGGEAAERVAEACRNEILADFIRTDLRAVLEVVGEDGGVMDHLEGRQLHPGHALEGAWFMMVEGRDRGLPDVVQAGLRMLEWSWARGWDPIHGGILHFVDLHRGPTAAYEHDMKFWWTHCEGILACRFAGEITGEARYRAWLETIEEWSWARFDDPGAPDWFGYLHRDGSRSTDLKGNAWKGPFHLPRMLLEIATLDGAIERPVPVSLST